MIFGTLTYLSVYTVLINRITTCNVFQCQNIVKAGTHYFTYVQSLNTEDDFDLENDGEDQEIIKQRVYRAILQPQRGGHACLPVPCFSQYLALFKKKEIM